MKLITLIILLLFTTSQPQFIKGKGFEGYIFPEEYMEFGVPTYEDRYTPTDSEVTNAELIISQKLEAANTPIINQSQGYPIIHKKLRKYLRQYVGYKNNKGERILWVNFIWKKSSSAKGIQNEIIMVNDGGSYYWNIKVNLDTGQLSDLQINGFG